MTLAPFPLSAAWRNAGAVMAAMEPDRMRAVTVSYTHLDVYKRQVKFRGHEQSVGIVDEKSRQGNKKDGPDLSLIHI